MSTPQDITVKIHGRPRRTPLSSGEHSAATTDEEGDSSADTGVHLNSPEGEFPPLSDQEEGLVDDDSWTELSSQPVVPSESASRLSSAPAPRREVDRPRRASKREEEEDRYHHHHQHRDRRSQELPPRARRQPYRSPTPSDLGSHEDLSLAAEYGQGYAPGRRQAPYQYAPQQAPPGHAYGPAYGHHQHGYAQYPQHGAPAAGQLVRIPNGYTDPRYQYGGAPVQPPYYGGQGGHHGMPPPMVPPGNGYGHPDMMHHPQYMQHPGAPGYFPNFTAPPMQQFAQNPAMVAYVPVQGTAPSPAPVASTTPAPEAARTPSAPAEPQSNPGYEELKKMLLEERRDREKREEEARQAEEARVRKAKEEKIKQEEILAAAQQAAKDAKTSAEKKAAAEAEEAAKKAADEATKLKKEAEDALKKANDEAKENADKLKKEHEAALAAATANPPEKQKPIRFKDAVGRKFNFPFHLCQTWDGMEDLIKQAFVHVDVIGQHVAEGRYDLIGPNKEIILPAVWETVIEPDWDVTMHMWPLPEEPEPAEDDLLKALDAMNMQDNKDKKGKGKGKAKTKAKAPPAEQLAAFPPLFGGIEILDGPIPPAPPIAPGVPTDGLTGKKAKQQKASGWGGIFGRPPPKAKPKNPGAKKPPPVVP